MNRIRKITPIEEAPTVFRLYEEEKGYVRGYLMRTDRPCARNYHRAVDAAIRVFETVYCTIITVEIQGRGLQIIHDAEACPEYLLECVIQKLQSEEGFVSNNGKLFYGKFRKEDSIKAISVVWESGCVKVERDAEEHYRRDLADPKIEKPLLRFEYYLSYNDPGTYGYGIPKTVEHLKTIEVKTSPKIFNDSLEKAMTYLEGCIVK